MQKSMALATLIFWSLLASTISAQSQVDVANPAGTTPRQIEWHKTPTQGRVAASEKIGEEGAEAWARSKGYKPLLLPGQKGIAQGVDQVWMKPDGGTVSIESKCQGSPLKTGYGYEQGTPEHAVKASERMLKSANASVAQKEAVLQVLKAAEDGSLEVVVLRTKHVLGEPYAAICESSAKPTSQAAEMATTILKDTKVSTQFVAATSEATTVIHTKTPLPVSVGKAAVAVAPEASLIAKSTSVAMKNLSIAAKVAPKALPVVGLVIDGSLRASHANETESRFAAGEIDDKERVIDHARNGLGMAGGLGGATILGTQGALYGSALGPVGSVVGGVGGAAAGYFGGEKLADKAVDLGSDVIYEGTNLARSGSEWAGGKMSQAWVGTMSYFGR